MRTPCESIERLAAGLGIAPTPSCPDHPEFYPLFDGDTGVFTCWKCGSPLTAQAPFNQDVEGEG